MFKLASKEQFTGIILVIVGGLFLAMNFDLIPHIGSWDWNLIWPAFVIALGAYFILGKPKLNC